MALSAAQIVVWAHRTPSRSRSSFSVASGFSRTSCASFLRSTLMTVAPPMGRGPTSPVSRRSCLSRLAQAGLTAKVRAIWIVGIPRSCAASTRIRKSLAEGVGILASRRRAQQARQEDTTPPTKRDLTMRGMR